MQTSQSRVGFGKVFLIKPFSILWLSQLLSQLSLYLLNFVISLVIYEKTQSNTAVSLLYLAIGLPSAIFGMVSGVIVDSLNKKWVLITSSSIRVILLLVLYFVRTNLTAVYILVAVIAIFSQFFVPAEASLIPRYVPSDHLISANSLFILTFYAAIIGGFVAGGQLTAILGVKLVILVMTAILILSTIILFWLPDIEGKLISGQISLRKYFFDFIEGINIIKFNRVIMQSILLLTLAQAVIAIITTLGPGFTDKILALKITDASLIILGPATLGMVIGAVFIGNFGSNWRKKTIINSGLFFSGLTLVIVTMLIRSDIYNKVETVFEQFFSMSLIKGILPITVCGFFILGFANSLIDVSCNSVLQQHTPEKLRGRVYGLLQTLIGLVGVIPVLVSGVIADLYGINQVLTILGVILILLTFYTSTIYPNFNNK